MAESARKDDEQLSPFERFKRFARAIVAVPKAEIEEQEAKYQRGRKRNNQARNAPPKGR
jgi:hypothetical protein